MSRAPLNPTGDRTLPVFLLIWALCGIGIGMTLHFGRTPAPAAHMTQVSIADRPATVTTDSPVLHSLDGSPWSALLENLNSPMGRLLSQLIIVVLATRTTGWLFRRIGLPSVVGEITAGILLGPSLFGWLWPGGFAFIFTPASLDI